MKLICITMLVMAGRGKGKEKWFDKIIQIGQRRLFKKNSDAKKNIFFAF